MKSFLGSSCEPWIFIRFNRCGLENSDKNANVICRRISMAGLSSKTVPHLADAIHAAVTRAA